MVKIRKIRAMETHEHIMAYYPLFEHMQSEHGLTLLESELQEIIRLSDEVKKLYNEASERSPFPSTESKCNKHIVTNRICPKANQCANTPGGCICPKNVTCPL